MSRHLPILAATFPGELLLDIDQIATLTKYSKGHIYNLVSAKKLPFKLATGLGDKILVSVVEMADYMDSKLLSQTGEQAESEPSEVKKRVGRPRGTTSARFQIHAFQGALRAAIYKFEVSEILAELRGVAENVVLISDDRLSCTEKFTLVKISLIDQVSRAEEQFSDIDTRLSTPLALLTNADLGHSNGTL